jgi:hypothetical protein
MADLNHLDCKIFVEARQNLDDFVALLIPSLPERGISESPGGRTVQTKFGDVEIRRNEVADELQARKFPDGFLHFSYCLELYLNPAISQKERVHFVAGMLNGLWSQGLPAVAACDYENELPHGGGYQDTSLPWPTLSPTVTPI